MFIISFIIGLIFVKKNMARKDVVINRDQYESFIFYVMLGVMIGGRLGYVLFYGLRYYIANPQLIFAVWQGGMSFHGGALGCIIAGAIFCKIHKYNFYKLADPTMPFVALGLGFGRIGNFINGELYGRATDVPWAVIFPHVDMLPRHPSQLYQALLEGFLMAIILQIILVRTKLKGLVFWLFIGLYGMARFFVEYIRIPDDISLYEDGLLFDAFTMGQVLSIVMLIASAVGLLFVFMKRTKQ
jgi:phosphatidylglycerol:prolipoprotein diacylglycerol transferase